MLASFAALLALAVSPATPSLTYRLSVDRSDASSFSVELRIRYGPDTLRLAMFAHPEYDDQYFRYLEQLTVSGPGGPVPVTRMDSTSWRAVVPGGNATVRYRIQLPPLPEPRNRAAWKAYLTPTGGLVGGPHAFLYLLGAERAPSHVTLRLPDDWTAATGLAATSDPATFSAGSAEELMDSPIFVGQFRSWRFSVDGVPHRVVYWPAPDATPFDTAAFVGGITGITREAFNLFHTAPYREFTFMYQDGSYGGLEHATSATFGAPSAELARDVNSHMMETAHEFAHTWNLVYLRPAERGEITHLPPAPARELWWSEGMSMFYADLLLRRAGLPTFDTTRIDHLQRLIRSYTGAPGNALHSAEAVSLAAYGAPPGALGDDDASTHLQGELIGSMLDMLVRSRTSGRKSIDDVMRVMVERYGGARGFTSRDIERTVAEVCGCSVAPFFDAHVRSAAPIPFNTYLALLGLEVTIGTEPAIAPDGSPYPDLRVRGWMPPGWTEPSLLIYNHTTVWGRAGLHTGDRVMAVNGVAVHSAQELRTIFSSFRIGDTARVEVRRPAGMFRTTVHITAQDRPLVRITPLPGATAAQRALREAWLAGR